MTAPAFGERLSSGIEEHGGLCVGIDPHPGLLTEWGLPADAGGAREFGLRVVEAAAGNAAVVKPQVAFFERYGADGYAALERVIREARSAGLLVIADAKRGDIGSTLESYAAAWLSDGAPLESDAMTVSAYQGVGSLDAAVAIAEKNAKGLFVLAATSNPEAAAIQLADVGPSDAGATRRSVARVIIEDVKALNIRSAASGAGSARVGSFGVVLGATLDLAAFGVDTAGEHRPALPVLAPGFGVQGARIEDAAHIYGSLFPTTLASESRSILSGGPSGLAERIAERGRVLKAALD